MSDNPTLSLSFTKKLKSILTFYQEFKISIEKYFVVEMIRKLFCLHAKSAFLQLG